MARYDDLNTKMIAYWAVLSVIILVILLQGTQALCYSLVNSVENNSVGSEEAVPVAIKNEQISSLSGYGKEKVLDESMPPPKKGEAPAMKEVIHIPISEAQKLLLKEIGTVPGSGT